MAKVLRAPTVTNPRAPLRAVALLTHVSAGLALLVVPFAQTDWPVPKAAQPSIVLSTHSDSFKLPLTTVKPPYTEYNWPNPRGYPPLNVGWSDNFKLPILGPTGQPFNQVEWPIVRVVQPSALQTFTDSFKLPLTTITAPYTEYNWPVPRAPEYPISLRTWFQFGQRVTVEYPFTQTEWPNPGRVQQPIALTWTDAFKLPLTTVVGFNQYNWPYPQVPIRSFDLSWYSSGPSVTRVTAYPATITFNYPNPTEKRPVALSWSDAFKLPLTTVRPPSQLRDWPNPPAPRPVVQFGFVKPTDPKINPPTGSPNVQYDWPVPKAKQPVTVTWSDSFRLPLTTVRPAGRQQDWPLVLPVRELATQRNWSGRFSLTLTTVRPAGRQLDWPVPKGYRPIQVGFAGTPYGIFTTPPVVSHYEIEGTCQVTFYSAYILNQDQNVPTDVTLIDVSGTEAPSEVTLIDVDDEEEPTNVNLIQDPTT